jgi:hypothetical protein
MSLADKEHQRLSYQLLRAFTRALGQKIRTPLSVISNDLVYFKSVLPEGEAERAIRNCHLINDIIGAGTMAQDASGFEEHFLLADVVTERCRIAGKLDLLECELQSPVTLRGESSLLGTALGIVLTALDHFVGSASKNITIVLSPSGEGEDRCVLTLASVDQPNEGESRLFDTLTKLFNEELGVDAIEIPLADAIFSAHGCSVSINWKNAIVWQINIEFFLESER